MFNEMREAGSKLPDMVDFLKSNGWKTYYHHDNWIKKGIEGEYDTHQAYEIAKNNAESLKYGVELLCNALREDPNYYISWQANIAMAFKDEYDRTSDVFKNDIHTIANEAAKNFLNLLINK